MVNRGIFLCQLLNDHEYGKREESPVNRGTRITRDPIKFHSSLLSVIFISLNSGVVCTEISIGVTPSMDSGPLIWKTDMVIQCSWPPNGKDGDILIDGTSAWSHIQYTEMVMADGMSNCFIL